MKRTISAAIAAVAMGLQASEYDIAAYVWPAYQPELRWGEMGIYAEGKGEWQNVWEAVPKWEGHRQPLVPLWGYENEADPKVMEKKIDAAVSYGVNVFIYDWYWYDKRPFLEDALDKGFLGAKNNGKMKFFIMWANHNVVKLWDNKVADKEWDNPIWRAGVDAEEFRKISRRWIEMYFSRPNYYRIDGKPVFMIYEATHFVQWIGGRRAAAEAMRRFREDCVAAGLGGVHIMACSWNAIRPEDIETLGVESATMYTYAHHIRPRGEYGPWTERGLAKLDSEKARLKGLKAYFAHASVGWDSNPRYPEVLHNVVNSTPAEFESVLRRAKDWCDRNTPEGYPKLISINAWNEWIEGSYLEPDEKYGMGYLEAVKRVFGSPGK